MKGLILALQFLTRLPMPRLSGHEAREMSLAAVWFPVAGLVIGLLLVLAAHLGMGADRWVAALFVVLMWTAVTGALHLDGVADVADALGAAHGDPGRLHTVMKDPHVGAFGAIAILVILLGKLVGAAWLLASPQAHTWAMLLLIPAWARLGTVFWAKTLDPIAPGSGESFASGIAEKTLWLWGVALFVASLFAVSAWFALAAIAIVLAWRTYLQWRLGGMSGDCLGAGIEWCEFAMLLVAGML